MLMRYSLYFSAQELFVLLQINMLFRARRQTDYPDPQAGTVTAALLFRQAPGSCRSHTI